MEQKKMEKLLRKFPKKFNKKFLRIKGYKSFNFGCVYRLCFVTDFATFTDEPMWHTEHHEQAYSGR